MSIGKHAYATSLIFLGFLNVDAFASNALESKNFEQIKSSEISNPKNNGFSIPVRILQNPEDLERLRIREEDADRRDLQNVEAQQSIEKSTREMVEISWWQLVLASAGTTLVIGSFWLAFWSNWIARDTARRELRAYVCLNNAEVVDPPDALGFMAFIEFVNFGQTPAHNVTIRCRSKTVGAARLKSFESDLSHVDPTEPSVFGPGAGIRKNIDNVLSPKEIDSILREECIIAIIGDVRYVDIFGNEQSTEFRLRVRNIRTDSQRIHPMETGNTAT